MSKKTTKRIIVPKPTIKETTMPIDSALFNPSPSAYRYRSNLDKELAEEDQMDARDLKRLRVREITAKREARIREFEKRSGTGNLNGRFSRERDVLARALITNPKIQQDWLDMNPESRSILLASANTLTQQNQNPGTLSAYLPFMMLQMKQNPQTSSKELIELINVLRPTGNPGKSETTELLKVLIPALQQQPSSKGTVAETLNVVLALFDRMAQKDRQLYTQQLKHLEGQIINPLEWIKSMQSNAKIFNQGAPNIEIERLRAENQERMMRLNFEHQRWRDDKDLEIVAEKGRMDLMSSMINKGLDTAAPLLEKFIGGIEKKKVNPPGVKAEFTLKCVKCGTPIPIIGDPSSVNCPNCGLAHQKNLLDQPAPPPPKVQTGHGTFTMVQKP